jgi:hypothetical protein
VKEFELNQCKRFAEEEGLQLLEQAAGILPVHYIPDKKMLTNTCVDEVMRIAKIALCRALLEFAAISLVATNSSFMATSSTRYH